MSKQEMKATRQPLPLDHSLAVQILALSRDDGGLIGELKRKVDKQDDIVSDCLHYIELCNLDAVKTLKVVSVMREALRLKRKYMDERTVLRHAVNLLKNQRNLEGQANKVMSENRSYTVKQLTLEEVLSK